MVEILRNREKVDLVVCLSHSGTSPVKKLLATFPFISGATRKSIFSAAAKPSATVSI